MAKKKENHHISLEVDRIPIIVCRLVTSLNSNMIHMLSEKEGETANLTKDHNGKRLVEQIINVI